MLLLSFGNKAQHGKDTAGEAVVEYFNNIRSRAERNYNSRFTRPAAQLFKFADALYDECRTLHGMKEKDASLLQRIGQGRRLENENYWVDKAFAAMTESQAEIAVFSDIRYLNEAEAVWEKGGYVINVSRLNRDGSPFVASDRPSDHISEIQLDDAPFDFFIKAYTGEAALVEQQAITIAEYVRGLKS